MKLNWGWGLVIALVLFALFIGQFFVRGFSHRADLVADDYYNQEVNYQQRIDGTSRAKAMGAVVLAPKGETLSIQFPKGFQGANATGNIQFYKPNNSDLDQHYPLAIDSSNQQIINLTTLPRGLWKIKIEAQLNNQGYFWEESIHL